MNIKNLNTKFFGNNETLSMYLNEIRKYKVPTVQEEEELLERIKNGDENAKNELIVRNQRFIYALAKRYAKSEDDVLEYVDEGNIGLMQAFNAFDPDKGYRFLTFAVWYVQRSMNYYLQNTNNMVVRSNNMKLSKKIDSVKNHYFNEHGYAPTNEEVVDLIKDIYDIDIKNICDVYDVNVSSINDEIDDDFTVEENSEFNNVTASHNSYEDDVDKEYAVMIISKLLLNLKNSMHRDIIKMQYGIDYDRVYSFTEIGDKYNMYPEDVAELSKTIIKYLRQELSYKKAV